MRYDLCVVGSGPAGMLAGLLFARAGVATVIVDAQADVAHDDGDVGLHPSTINLLDELGLLKALLERPHDKIRIVSAAFDRRSYRVADFGRLSGRGRFVAVMPRRDILGILAEKARGYPNLTFLDAKASELIGDGSRVTGVRTSRDEIDARLVIVADGRDLLLSGSANWMRDDLRAAVDVFRFRIPKAQTPDNRTQVHVGAGELLATIDRGDHFQCMRLVARGAGEQLRQLGLHRFRMDVARIAPALAGWLDDLDDWQKIGLRGVPLDRLQRWWRPGLLAIGDAAHSMSPIGEVGLALAIQDAVAAANILAGPMARGEDVDPLLRRVQARRMLPVRAMQAMQRTIHDRVIGRALRGTRPRAPMIVMLLDKVPALQRIPAWIVGLGIRREHIRSP